MPSESTPKRLQEALKAPKDPPDPPSPAKRKSGSDETPSVQDATNTPSRVDERPQTPVNKPNPSSAAHPTSASNPSTPNTPTNPTNPTTPHIHISPTALLSSPSPLRRTPATPSTRRITRSSSAIRDLNAAPSSTSEVTRLTSSRSTGETLFQQSLFAPGAASPVPADSAGTRPRTRPAATSQPNANGRSYANAAKQALPTTPAARQRTSYDIQFPFTFGAQQQNPLETDPLPLALSTEREDCLAISVPRETTPFEVSLAISKCDQKLVALIRPFKDQKGRMLLQIRDGEDSQSILSQLQTLPLDVGGVKPQIHSCFNTQNKLLQEGLLENFEEGDGVEEQFRKQVASSGDCVIFFQRQFDPRLPTAPTGIVRVLLDLSGSKKMPKADSYYQELTKWENRELIFRPIQAASTLKSPNRRTSTYCYYCHSFEHARPTCPTAPECGGCGSHAHPSTRCPGRPKANLPASARARTEGPPQRPVKPGPDLDGYQLVQKSKRRSLDRPTEATTEVATPPAHAVSSHSQSEQAPRNAGSQPIRTLSALEDDNEGGLARSEDGMQVEDEHPPPTPPPLPPSSPPPPSPSPPSSSPLNPPSTPSLIPSTPSSQASIERTLVTLAEAEDMEE
jgi:hypothetical protein